jgi:hypothetical protein
MHKFLDLHLLRTQHTAQQRHSVIKVVQSYAKSNAKAREALQPNSMFMKKWPALEDDFRTHLLHADSLQLQSI